MKTLSVIVLASVVALSGCANHPRRSAALVGVGVGAVGALAASSLFSSPQQAAQPAPVQIAQPQPVIRCFSRFMGYDYYRNPMYQEVCR